MDEQTMTAQEAPSPTDAREERGSLRPLLWLAAGLGVIALVALGYLWFQGARRGESDVVEISADSPVRVDEPAVLQRLNSSTEGDWAATRYSGPQLADLEDTPGLALDVDRAARSRTVITNIEDDASVARNGRLVVVGPSFRPAVERLLRDDPVVFSTSSVEDERRTYRLGGWIAYYSPAGADEDRSDVVEHYLADVAACPYDADECPGGAS